MHLMKKDFCKDVNCPSSEELFNFQAGQLNSSKVEELKNHISECDFCASEISLYTKLKRLEASRKKIAPMPLALFALAKAILSGYLERGILTQQLKS